MGAYSRVYGSGAIVGNNIQLVHSTNAWRTPELSAQLRGIRDCLRKLFPQVCGGLLCDFQHFLIVCARSELLAH